MFLSSLKILLIALEVVLVFNLMIVVHELGHFLAARWRGLVIEKFGIWFGKPIWKKRIGGVEYSLGSIPAGGFVALPQMAPMEVVEGETETPREALPPISALDKIIVAFAGPLFSFGLAIAFACVVWIIGRPVSEAEATTTIGYILPDSPAETAGLKPGDKIVAVDGRPVTRFGGMREDSVTWRIVRSEGETIPITVERNDNGTTQRITAETKPRIPETKPWMRKALRQIEIMPGETPMVAKVEPGAPAAKAGLLPNDFITGINGRRLYHILGIADFIRDHAGEPLTLNVEREGRAIALPFEPGGATVGSIVTQSPAERAGLKKGDVVAAVDGKKMSGAMAVTDYIKAHRGEVITLSILRGGENTEIKVTPEIPVGETMPRIGISWDEDYGIMLDAYGRFSVLHPTPAEQIRAGMMSIFNTVGAIVSRKSDVKLQHMGGPVMMMRIYYLMFESKEGWRMAIWFSVVLNVNLALINLLPIPVLDGGHITLALVEAVRRRPVNVRVLEIVQTACAMVIIGFMLYIAFFDVQDLFGGKSEGMKFSPKSSAAETGK
ncbi:MAG: regulator of sigma protease [Chthoniobacter sp.]|jgi:regulator of sigma E protease|nr:regulator of sigma protease [Chthoniobacter sp.]